MNSATITDADDLEDEAPARPPTRRDGRIIAMPAEPIPAEVNADFLDALAVERVLSMARSLASVVARPVHFTAEAHQAGSWQLRPSEPLPAAVDLP
jgi:hypothetical protein